MPDLSDMFENSKKLILIVCAIFAVFIAAVVGLKIYKNATADKTPIVSIIVKNSNLYKTSDTIKPKDFEITAKHKDGGVSTMTGDDAVKISRNHVLGYGKTTKVKVTISNGVSCETEVKNERSKIVSFNIAKYKTDKVKATLYSNGELAFEGNGEVKGYGEDDEPWKDDDNLKDTPIKTVTFEKGVKVIDGTKYFSGIETIKYVGALPATLVSANSMFSDCTALKAVPDMTGCAVLKDTTSEFSNCTSLTNAGIIPASVVTAADMFTECTALDKPAVFAAGSQTTDATEMYAKCTALTDPGKLPKKLNTMASMYSECTNLAKMPKIPEKVKTMSSAFESCKLLKSFTTIPAGVKQIDSCFSGCTYLSGTIRIDANAEEYGGLFGDAATATKVNLVGKSKLLNEYAYTSDNPQGHIYVRGHAAKDPDAY